VIPVKVGPSNVGGDTVGARSYRHVDSILKNGLDRVPVEPEASAPASSEGELHENVRGRDYYH
jgi:hypothetical protein